MNVSGEILRQKQKARENESRALESIELHFFIPGAALPPD